MRIFLFFFLFMLNFPAKAQSDSSRYFYHGDGQLTVKGGKLQNLSGRLVALLDYLQDHFTQGKGEIEIISGYRPSKYNEQLRQEGRLAAKASLHIEGMAVDFSLQGVKSRDLWHYIRQLNCCGAGHYAGRMVHLDVGPARFWDQKTSKVFTDISDHNKRIYLTTDYDIYRLGEKINMRLVRITDYPFGIQREVQVVGEDGNILKKIKRDKDCQMVANREEAQDFSLTLPRGLPKDKRLQIKAQFCSKPHEQMPDFVLSNPFVIR